MKAIVASAFGGTDAFELEEMPPPTPGPEEVLVRVRTAGVNPADAYIRAGTYGLRPPLPYTPGLDGAGDVEAVGPAVKGIKPGDRMYIGVDHTGMPRTGTYAEYAL